MINRRVDISYKTILFIAGFIAILWALYLIKEVIILLFVAIIFMSGLSPLVDKLEDDLNVPKPLAISLIYFIILVIIATLISLTLTPFVEQTSNLMTHFPTTVSKILPPGIDMNVIEQQATDFSKNALGFTLLIFNNFLAMVSILVLTFYLLLERDKLDKLVTQFAIGHEERVKRVLDKIEEKLGSWLRGQIVLSLLIGILCYIALLLINVPYALPLAIVAGLLEVLPVIGPIISAIPAILIALLASPVQALLVGLSYLIIQQAESHVIVPQVMKKAVGLNPLIVILAVSIGGRLLGFSGALLAVPISVVIQIVTEDILREEKIDLQSGKKV
jgi:predicted PurR-regulated permease PerM